MRQITYTNVPAPQAAANYVPVDLTAETMRQRRDKVFAAMEAQRFDALLVYADREHGSNFAYLTGFAPRFEEAVLVLHRDGRTVMMLGNENLKMAARSLLPIDQVVHVPHFSLPCQPMGTEYSLPALFVQAGIENGMRLGLAGWKFFTSEYDDNSALFDIPSFIVDAVRTADPDGGLISAGGIFLDPASGVRTVYNANEIAHFEFGAGLASSRVLAAMDAVAVGKNELEIADVLTCCGQTPTVTTICATGDRFTNAVIAPRNKAVALGDTFSLTLGLEGGLTSRAAYVARTEEDLPEKVRDYVDKVAIPYYRACVAWLETAAAGVKAGALYDAVEAVLPKAEYHWVLNPGHYTDRDEWSSSPCYPGSGIPLRSGMLFQLDIIPSVPGYGGVSEEDGLAIADAKLRGEIASEYPEVWARFERRRHYMKDVLNIQISDDILPLSDTLGYLRPLLLDHDRALKA